MARTSRRLLVASVASVALLGAAAAWAWTEEAPIRVTVHSHKFHGVRLSSAECVLKASLWFNAPEAGYSSRYASQNQFRFQARIGLSEGRQLVSPVFSNRGAGERVYRFEHDTSPEGCWAKPELKLERVDVDGCRNRGCEIPAFQ